MCKEWEEGPQHLPHRAIALVPTPPPITLRRANGPKTCQPRATPWVPANNTNQALKGRHKPSNLS